MAGSALQVVDHTSMYAVVVHALTVGVASQVYYIQN